MLGKVRITYEKKQLIYSLILLGLGFLAPVFLKESQFGIYTSLQAASLYRDSSYILLAVVKLVAMNCLRTTPNYLGAFVISEGLTISVGKREFILVKGLLSIGVLYLIYTLIYYVSGIWYHLGMPAIIIVLFLTILSRLKLFSVSIFNKAVIIALVIITVQSLTVLPQLTRFGFGRGEISMDIKSMALLLDYGRPLSLFSIFLFIIFFCASAICIKLVNDEQRLNISVMERERMENQLAETRIKVLELRTLREIQNLVHDLKTPLTTVQGLSSLTELIAEDPRIREYQQRITGAVESMNNMISEILYEDRKNEVDTETLMKLISSYSTVNDQMQNMIQYHNACPGRRVLMNKIRLVRAIINVIENASTAVANSRTKNGLILVEISAEEGWVVIRITDNGIGIKQEDLELVWKPGYSMSCSTGLGLAFIKNVVENHGGKITIESREGEYTCVTIWLKEV